MRTDGTTWHGWIRFYLTAYYPSRLRWWWHEQVPWWVAWMLPRKVALLAFIRVYGVLGHCGPEFDWITKEWDRRGRRP